MVSLISFASALFSGLWSAQSVPPELTDYVNKKDASYSFTMPPQGGSGPFVVEQFQMTSQTWHGIPWKHEIIVISDPGSRQTRLPDTAVLIITGGKSNPKDLSDAGQLCKISGMPVATLFEIPNQPLYGMKEDDLIAHTFEEYFKSGDATWPLLFPMVKSAVGAMNGLEKMMGIHHFVVTGASKRGWTTWLTAATGDKRVVGIAPIVYDNLNLLAQLPHQKALWGYYSEQIADYTRRGLQNALASPAGLKLARMVDPYSYLPRIHVPIFMLNGANDPYWAPDAQSLFRSALPKTARTLYLPNEAHTFHDKTMALEALGTFARLSASRELLPFVDAEQRGHRIVVRTSKGLFHAQLYVAESSNSDFHLSTWKPVDGFQIPASTEKQGALVIGTFMVDGKKVSVSSPILLVK